MYVNPDERLHIATILGSYFIVNNEALCIKNRLVFPYNFNKQPYQ